MVVRSINQSDPNGCFPQSTSGGKTTESSTDNHDMRQRSLCHSIAFFCIRLIKKQSLYRAASDTQSLHKMVEREGKRGKWARQLNTPCQPSGANGLALPTGWHYGSVLQENVVPA